MAAPRTISLDAMGGDQGPAVVVPGAALALERHPELSFLLVGDRARIQPHLDQLPALAERARIVHTDIAIEMQDKPSQAVRRGRGSSMWLALEAVQKGEADVAVSAGNTGALMAMAKLVLRTMPGIERPVIAGQWPTVGHNSIVLDLGANIGATARQLADFALMGAAMARALFGIERPRVGLLNIGVEEIKGIEEVRQAHAWLKENDLPIDYRGFVEGDQIGQGIVDVVVVEGYAGNIALKTAEGTARQMAAYVREALTSSLAAKARRAAGRAWPACAEGPHGPAAPQRRAVPGPQRHCDQESRGHGRIRLRQRHRGRLRHGAKQPVGAPRSRPGIAARQARRKHAAGSETGMRRERLADRARTR